MKTWYALCALAIACAFSVGTAAGTNTLTNANQALRAGDTGRAIALYSDALHGDGISGADRARALLNRGLAQERAGRHVEAVLDYTSAIQLRQFQQDDLARAFLDRGIALDELGKPDDALADYSAAIVIVPAFPAALNNRGNLYRRRGELRNARHDYELSLISGNATPEYPLYGLGQIAEVEGDRRAALGFYGEAHAANPSFALAAQRLLALQSEAQLRGAPAKKSTIKPAPPMRGPH